MNSIIPPNGFVDSPGQEDYPVVVKPLAFCTVIRRKQLPAARVLALSLRRRHPGASLHVLLADQARRGPEPWTWVGPEELGVAGLPALRSRSSPREFAAALKPSYFSWLIHERSITRLVYLSPDTLVLAPLSALARKLERASVLLVPHRLAPSPGDARSPDEMTFIDRGAYNLGFLALRRDARSRRFLSWWAERLSRHCADDPSNGLYLDQRWCDLAPGLFEGVEILRDERFGAAAWGRGCEGLRWRKGALWAGRARAAFFQFQGARDAPGLRRFFRSYRALLERHAA